MPVLWINSADDFINPPGLGDPEAVAAAMPNARFVLVPATDQTHGHGTHTWPIFWIDDLAQFLADNPWRECLWSEIAAGGHAASLS